MTTSTGLWNEGFGAVGATLKALENAGGTPELLKLIRSNQNVAKAVVEAGNAFLRTRYAYEEVASNYTYPNDYAVKPIAEQIAVLSKFFSLDGEKALAHSKNLSELPEGAEGWFAILKWQVVAKDYGKAVKEVLVAIIGKKWTLENWREEQFGERYLRQSEITEQMFTKLCEKQDGDIIIIPAQFGLRHRGRSVRRAREVFVGNEFGLGSFAIGCMLLAHPEREQVWGQLHIDCAGDEFAPDGDDEFTSTSVFCWYGDRLRFNARRTDDAGGQRGSVSGFVPKSLLAAKGISNSFK